MLMRMFLNAHTEDESMEIVADILSPLKVHIKHDVKIESEPYWKIDGIYSVDVYMNLNVNDLGKEIFEKFLKTIANQWITYGEPTNEILISKNDKETIVYNENIEMMNIFFDDY